MTAHVLPSPLAQNSIAFLLERLAGAMGAGPRENMAPAQRGSRLSSIVPLITNELLLPRAPPLAIAISAFDLPPTKLSVEMAQPFPKDDFTSGPSKSLTRPLSEPGGAGEALALARAAVCLATRAR